MKAIPLKTYLVLTAVSLLYGVNYSILKIIVPEHIGPFGFIVYRVIVSLIVFAAVYRLSFQPIDWKRDGWRLVACGLTGIAINQLLFYKGISLTSAVNGSIIMTLTPILVMIWAWLLHGERITWVKILGIALGLAGALLILSKAGGRGAGDWRGDVLVFINGASYGLYLVIVKPLMTRYRPLTVITWAFAFGLMFVIPVGWGEAAQLNVALLPAKVWWSAAYAIIGVTVVVYFLNAWTLQHVPSTVVGAFIYLQPVFATLTAILFFGEVFLLKHLLAMLLVFSGVYLVTKPSVLPRADEVAHRQNPDV